MAIDIRARTESASSILSEVRIAVGGQRNLSDVVNWVAALGRREVFADIIAQDEYTHDVIVRFRDEFFLVYDATWLGIVTSVSVWDHQPSADELLDFRLESGWRPTPSAMSDGAKVLGHAASVAPGEATG